MGWLELDFEFLQGRCYIYVLYIHLNSLSELVFLYCMYHTCTSKIFVVIKGAVR